MKRKQCDGLSGNRQSFPAQASTKFHLTPPARSPLPKPKVMSDVAPPKLNGKLSSNPPQLLPKSEERGEAQDLDILSSRRLPAAGNVAGLNACLQPTPPMGLDPSRDLERRSQGSKANLSRAISLLRERRRLREGREGMQGVATAGQRGEGIAGLWS